MAQNFRQITNEAVLQKPYINEFDAKKLWNKMVCE